ncbi:MAG: pyridoxamine 5'-phosphate oxidase family protein [Saprospiraceae bacterium]|nr:pyridoxamine 5'-phosphate oxidase family protein [Saprospiraceae bacterium]
MKEVFHQGELAVQKMAGQSDMARRVGRMIGSEIMGPAIPFIQNQSTAYLGSVDPAGRLWASLLLGEEGFVEVADERGVIFHKEMIRSTSLDLLYQNIEQNPQVGVLFMEPEYRRRYRVNGPLTNEKNQLLLNVKEAFGNCPKYIQASTITLPQQPPPLSTIVNTGSTLRKEFTDWVRQADTFILSTRSAAGKVDTSHRGGRPGFIEVLPDGRLRIPDYPGNSLFQTLGNIYENPNTGLLFVDFQKGETLQLTGKGELAFDQNSETDLNKSGDTGRFWLFQTEKWIHTQQHHAVDWAFLSYSPFNP